MKGSVAGLGALSPSPQGWQNAPSLATLQMDDGAEASFSAAVVKSGSHILVSPFAHREERNDDSRRAQVDRRRKKGGKMKR